MPRENKPPVVEEKQWLFFQPEKGCVRSLVEQCVDLVVRNITNCASLESLPLGVQAGLLSLVCRRRVCDRRLLRLFSPLLHIDSHMLRHSVGIARSGLKVLAHFARVAALDLSGLKAHDCRHIGPVVARMRGLTSLNLRCYPHHLNLKDMKALAGASCLTHLDLSRSRVEDAHVNLLSKSTSLTSLNISQCGGLSGSLEGLAEMTQLRALNISNMNLLPIVMDTLERLTSLVTLNASLSRWLKDTSRLAGLTRLRELNLAYTPLGDEALEGLLHMTQLRTLSLRSTAITDTGIDQYLTNLQKLERIDLSALSVSRSVKRLLLQEGRCPNMKQVTMLPARLFSEGDLLAIKSVRPEVMLLCKHTSFQDAMSWTFDGTEASADPELCVDLLKFLRMRIFHGDTKDTEADSEESWEVIRRPTRMRHHGLRGMDRASAILTFIFAGQQKCNKADHKARALRKAATESLSDSEDHNEAAMLHVPRVRTLGLFLERVLQLVPPLLVRMACTHFSHLEVVNQSINLARQLVHARASRRVYYFPNGYNEPEEYEEGLADPEWLGFLYRCLSTYSSHPATVKNVLKLLKHIELNKSTVVLAYSKRRLFVRTIVDLMRIHAGDVSILSRSLSLLQHLTPDITPESMRKVSEEELWRLKGCVGLVLGSGAVPAMVCAIAQHPYQPRLFQAALSFAEHITNCPMVKKVVAAFLQAGAVAVLQPALRIFAKTESTKTNPFVAQGYRIIRLLLHNERVVLSKTHDWQMCRTPVPVPSKKQLATILPSDTKRELNRNRRQRKKQAKQRKAYAKLMDQHKAAKKVIKREMVARKSWRMARAEHTEAQQELLERGLSRRKEQISEKWFKNAKSRIKCLKKTHRIIPRTLHRRGGQPYSHSSYRTKKAHRDHAFEDDFWVR